MYTFQNENADFARIFLSHRPYAAAYIKGSASYPDTAGPLHCYPAGDRGILVVSKISGLPVETGICTQRFFAVHVHENGACRGTEEEPFKDAGGHYNPKQCPHPMHAGDLPPLLSNARGKAFGAVLCDGFTLNEILGKSVIIHRAPDDFTSQPAGNAGERIACGTIVKNMSRR